MAAITFLARYIRSRGDNLTPNRFKLHDDSTLVKGLVSIMMPVMNGDAFLEGALDCLLAQDYPDFEVIILDNLSTDRTPEICRQYESKDQRIRYIRDSEDRITHDAANHLATFVRGEFAAYACDDDLHDPTFLRSMVDTLREDPSLGLAYCNGAYVDVEGEKGKRSLLGAKSKMGRGDGALWNVWRYMRQRKVVPTLFGVYRTSALRSCLPFETFDETIADVDNLFMIQLLCRYPVQCVDKQLFWFRNKFRAVEPTFLKGMSANPTAFERWLYQARHQRTFLKMQFSAIAASPFAAPTRAILMLRAIYTYLFFIFVAPIRAWVGRALQRMNLREGITSKPDKHHEKRVAAHRSIGFRVHDNESAKVRDDNV